MILFEPEAEPKGEKSEALKGSLKATVDKLLVKDAHPHVSLTNEVAFLEILETGLKRAKGALKTENPL